MYLILCASNMTEKTKETQEIRYNANYTLRYFSHKQERVREASSSVPGHHCTREKASWGKNK